jgi:hypothetical protein
VRKIVALEAPADSSGVAEEGLFDRVARLVLVEVHLFEEGAVLGDFERRHVEMGGVRGIERTSVAERAFGGIVGRRERHQRDSFAGAQGAQETKIAACCRYCFVEFRAVMGLESKTAHFRKQAAKLGMGGRRRVWRAGFLGALRTCFA